MSWEWRPEAPISRGDREAGVIAQDVLAVFPALVDRAPKGHLRVDYGGLALELKEALIELDDKMQDLEGPQAANDPVGTALAKLRAGELRSIDHTALVGTLVEAVKELDHRIGEIEDRANQSAPAAQTPMFESPTDLSVQEFLDAVADPSPRAASGSLAAATVAAASGLVTMAARRSGSWTGSGSAAGQAEVLRRRATELIAESSEAFEGAVAELGSQPAPGDKTEQRDWKLGEALQRAADAPLAVAEIAGDTAMLAADVASVCAVEARADAVSACLLAEAAAAVATHLVEVNLATGADDARLARARDASGNAARSRTAVLALPA